MKYENSEDDEFVTLTEEDLNQFNEEYEFEFSFFETIANSSKFEIIAIPNEQGQIPTFEERDYLRKEGKRLGIKILYRISQGNQAIIYDSESFKLGLIPENEVNGFSC